MSVTEPVHSEPTDLSDVAASQGLKTHRVRWVLISSLGLAIAAVGLSFVLYVATQGARTAQAPASAVALDER
jgi:hypothetical protein